MRNVRLAFLLFVVLFSTARTYAQSDSLWTVWKNKELPDSARLKAIQALSWKAVFEKPDSGIALAEDQLVLAMRMSDAKARFTAYNTLAVGHKMRSDLNTSLEYFNRCLEVAREMKDQGRIANTYSNMSTVYKDLGDLPRALDLLHQSLNIDAELGNKEGQAGTYNNIGNIHKRLNDYAKALQNYERSAALYEELGRKKGRADAMVSIGTMHNELGQGLQAVEELMLAISLYEELGSKLDLGKAHNNLGQVYGRLKRFDEAVAQLDQARVIFKELNNGASLARNHFYKGEVLLAKGDAHGAAFECEQGDVLAQELNLLAQRKECSDCLMRAYAITGDFRRGFAAQRSFIELDDSLDRLNDSKEVMRLELTQAFQQRQIADSLAQVRADFEKQREYDRQVGRERDQRNLFLFGGILAVIAAGALLNRLRYTNRAKKAIEKEKDRSDDLLHNILPKEVAAELKLTGSAEARAFDPATVLFTDFKGFTQLAEQLGPAELVAEIDTCFKGLDAIVEKYGLEKIKTIGDAYMAVAGLPDPGRSTAQDMVLAALEMQDFIQARRTQLLMADQPAFEMRAGIHTGPVIAGIVGVKKFAYDIWGDVVNIAARMESSGEVGKVNISAATYAAVKDAAGLRFESRGAIEAKNKGTMEMYFVHRA